MDGLHTLGTKRWRALWMGSEVLWWGSRIVGEDGQGRGGGACVGCWTCISYGVFDGEACRRMGLMPVLRTSRNGRRQFAGCQTGLLSRNVAEALGGAWAFDVHDAFAAGSDV